jgi:hypothetical protein
MDDAKKAIVSPSTDIEPVPEFGPRWMAYWFPERFNETLSRTWSPVPRFVLQTPLSSTGAASGDNVVVVVGIVVVVSTVVEVSPDGWVVTRSVVPVPVPSEHETATSRSSDRDDRASFPHTNELLYNMDVSARIIERDATAPSTGWPAPISLV